MGDGWLSEANSDGSIVLVNIAHLAGDCVLFLTFADKSCPVQREGNSRLDAQTADISDRAPETFFPVPSTHLESLPWWHPALPM
jgi:hypothetical protein